MSIAAQDCILQIFTLLLCGLSALCAAETEKLIAFRHWDGNTGRMSDNDCPGPLVESFNLASWPQYQPIPTHDYDNMRDKKPVAIYRRYKY